MKILFSHTNYPAQFGAFGMWLAQNGWDVTFATGRSDARPPSGCRMYHFDTAETGAEQTHRHAGPVDRAVRTAESFAARSIGLRDKGYTPDIVVAHSGWGSGTYAKAVWPEALYVPYFEWWYAHPRPDLHPDDPFPADGSGMRANALTRNAPTLLDFAQADMIFCPTQFQASRFPDWIRRELTVQHDGVDAATLAPDPGARATLAEYGVPEDAEILTYATRGMEPYRGFPEFMRAVEKLQKARPRLHVIIAGEDRIVYGRALPDGQTWKRKCLDELDLDESRLHFVGLLLPDRYRQLLQGTDVHTYLTLPFVLSWSFIEAMSIGCALVASDVAPVTEATGEGPEAAFLVDHFDIDALASAIAGALDNPAEARRRGEAARRRVLASYDRSWIWPSRAESLRSLVSPGA
jgi:glycosyltransferase involved in cell wall biosynthesis